jgi:hypothetical protein
LLKKHTPIYKAKRKEFPLQAWIVLEWSGRLRLPDFEIQNMNVLTLSELTPKEIFPVLVTVGV